MVQLHEMVFRDAHQSLLATRMRTEDMLPITDKIDKVGFFSLEVWGGATFDSCIRYLNEDPWERLKTLKTHLTDTPLQMLERGQNIVAYWNFSDDIVREFIHYAKKDGIDNFRIFDALNDVRNMRVAMEAAKREGAHVQACICYTISPVHTIDRYVEKAKELERMGSDSLCIKDMAGLITPGRAYELISRLREEVKIPIDLHSHFTSGMAMMSYMEACRAGVSILDTAMSPFSGGTAQPPTESVVAALRDTLYDTGYDLELLEECRKYFMKVWDKYSHLHSEKSMKVDTGVLIHQIPGGMLSNLVAQLKQQNALDKYDEVLAETPRVREDLGYPPLVTPTSQIVGTQAVLNVITGERYKIVPKEVKDYVRGMYGQPPGEISEEIKRKILGDNWEEQIITCRPADLIPNRLSEIRQEVEDLGLVSKPEDVLTYAIYPEVAKKFLRGELKPEFTSDMLPLEVKKPTAEVRRPSTPPPIVGGRRRFKIEVAGKIYEVEVEEIGVQPVTRRAERAAEQVAEQRVEEAAVEGVVKAPIPGKILSLKVGVGDRVKRDDVLLVLEAMKMQNDITAPRGGVIKQVLVSEGSNVEYGDVLVVIE